VKQTVRTCAAIKNLRVLHAQSVPPEIGGT
jgi:hypothetical protein